MDERAWLFSFLRRLTIIRRRELGQWQRSQQGWLATGKTDRVREPRERPSGSGNRFVYRFVGAKDYMVGGATCFTGGWIVFARCYWLPDGGCQSRGVAVRVGKFLSLIPLRWQWRHVYGYTDGEILFGRPKGVQ